MLQDTADRHRAYAFGSRDQSYLPSRATSVLRRKLVDSSGGGPDNGLCLHPCWLSMIGTATLESWTRSSTVSADQRERALIVLSVARGSGVSGTARSLGVSRPTVIKWRNRFTTNGLDGLADLLRSGRPKTIDDAQIIAATLEEPPASLAVTHWSTRLLGTHLGISDATVARAWRAYRVQPWRQGTFRFSTDPELEAKVRDVVGLYLDPPTNAVVLCVDEKSQIQALTGPSRSFPVRPGLPARATHDYKRKRDHDPFRRAGGRDRAGHRPLL